MWAGKIKHRSVYVVSENSDKHFTLNLSWIVRKFYAAANAIYYDTKTVHELLRLCLFESFVVPVLTYYFDGILVARECLNKLNVCWNNAYRNILVCMCGIL